VKIKIGFGYKQHETGLYLYDAKTGLVLFSEDDDGIGTAKLKWLLQTIILHFNELASDGLVEDPGHNKETV
jgi:hypothetical protein